MISKKVLLALLLPLSFSSVLAKNQVIPKFMDDPNLDENGVYSPNINKSKLSNLVLRNAKGTILSSLSGVVNPANWFNLSPADGAEGVRTEETYSKFGVAQINKDIIVAVVDSGVDVNHQDLQGKMWINKNEIPNNKIDDDKNGYVDDVYGWNFIGGKKGQATIVADSTLANGSRLVKGNVAYQIDHDSLEVTRELVRMKLKKKKLEANGQRLSASDAKYLAILKQEVSTSLTEAKNGLTRYQGYKSDFEKNLKILQDAGFSGSVTLDAVTAFETPDAAVSAAKGVLLNFLKRGISLTRLNGGIEYFSSQINYQYNESYNTRSIVGDVYLDFKNRSYGNNDVIGPDAHHGTHVSGIIAASRNNGIGINGIATKVKIMAVRVVPDGDERDKDVANGIRYAVDNGAQIINMSFGKDHSPYKAYVDEAVRYAQSKGVLLVHAAGNSNQDNDTAANFPNKKDEKLHKLFNNWLEIGASSISRDENLPADFSNYGKKSVDFFAPGVDILSSTPDDSYDTYSGTSMASPVVAGVAALTLSYKPTLKAAALKNQLVQSSRHDIGDLMVLLPGTSADDTAERVRFDSLSINGSIVDSFEAAASL